MAPAAAVAEWPEGKELEEGVFIRGAIPVSQRKGLVRLKRYFAPSASVQEAATAVQGIRSREGSKPASRNAPAATNPQRAPAVPATVNARMTDVSGAHFTPNIALNRARSRSLTLRAKPFKLLPWLVIRPAAIVDQRPPPDARSLPRNGEALPYQARFLK